MQIDIESAALDTSFPIRLLSKQYPLHDSAKNYYQTLQRRGVDIVVPIISITEYLVKGNWDELPVRDFRISPFNLEQAKKAAMFAAHLFERRSKGEFEVGDRNIIPNDVKIFAQAEIEGVQALLSADSESHKLYSSLHQAGLVSFSFWDIAHPLNEYLSELGV